jgi:Xaa-Pro aminopeptidase
MEPFNRRRNAIAAALDSTGGVAIVPAARERIRNNDTEYEFRQDSDFYYLSGFREPDAVLVIAPHHQRERIIAFVRPKDRAQEIWTGRRLGVQDAAERLGVDAAFAIDELDSRLPEYLYGAQRVYVTLGNDEAFDRRVHLALSAARGRARRKGRAPEEILDPAVLLHEMRLRKEADEIVTMRRAAAISGAGHHAGMKATRPGVYEYEIEGAIEYEYMRAGATFAYPSIVAGGDNATILHYNTNREVLRDGDLLLVDSGSEFDLYASDVTRTWPINGRFTAEQRAIYDIVLAAQEAGIDRVKPGVPCREFHDVCVRVITEGLLDIGLLQGSVDENIEKERYRDYYMHGSGHWLGLDVHDVGRYRTEDGEAYRTLEPGMVTTVEPGIYVHRDLDCDERFKGIGVRLEDNILVTETGNENLTAEIAKSVSDVESLVGDTACV